MKILKGLKNLEMSQRQIKDKTEEMAKKKKK